jgi:LuxR family maltose regulon positive regulatory protein
MNISSTTSIKESASLVKKDNVPRNVIRLSSKPTYRRAGLHKVLDELGGTPLIVVNGWSGSGKTTLVANYAESRRCPCLWYRADRNDDLVSFLYSLITSASEYGSLQNDGELYSALDQIDVANLVSLRQFFFKLFKQLDLPFLIVIDDLQEVQFLDAFHDLLRMACMGLPKGGRIVVINSGRPRLNVAKMRKLFPVAVLEDEDFELGVNEVREIAELYGRPAISPLEASRLWETAAGCTTCLLKLLNSEPV